MRADRLLAILMLMQTRGRLSARALAEELEVASRTIYRDIEALSAAGVPIYSEIGRDGGFALLDHYRTSLTGMTDGELRALFMLGVPEPLAKLGVSQELRNALLKLAAALPDTRQAMETQARARLHLDSAWWEQAEEAVPYLETIYKAVQQDHQLWIKYRLLHNVELEADVDPYGLVAKAGVWYLVYARHGAFRAQRVSHLVDVQPLSTTFMRDPDFDLASFWQTWVAEVGRRREGYPVTVLVAPGLAPLLPAFFGEGIRERQAQAAPADPEGRVTIELSFESLEAARERLLAFGAGIEVLRPEALRLSMIDYAGQILRRYNAAR
jgi:predicted DNA-binding transcriptional regulator YafY